MFYTFCYCANSHREFTRIFLELPGAPADYVELAVRRLGAERHNTNYRNEIELFRAFFRPLRLSVRTLDLLPGDTASKGRLSPGSPANRCLSPKRGRLPKGRSRGRSA